MTEYACETCGNPYHKAFQVVMDGKSHTFDCFECAIHALASRCTACGCRIIGHGVEARGEVYCCSGCAERQLPGEAAENGTGRNESVDASTEPPSLMDRAMVDPAGTFGGPSEVVHEDGLSRAQKVAVLKRWESDEHALIVAEEENMSGQRPARLREVLRALDEMGEAPAH